MSFTGEEGTLESEIVKIVKLYHNIHLREGRMDSDWITYHPTVDLQPHTPLADILRMEHVYPVI